MHSQSYSSQNFMWIEAPIEKIWSYFSTPQGWNDFLSDIAEIPSGKKEIESGDHIQIIIGELTNDADCIALLKPNMIKFHDHFSPILPDGTVWKYELETTFSLEQYEDMVKITVTVDGYSDDEMMQWIRECGEMGWRQSLFNLKCILELGLDLRNEIFNYPRLGVLNYTATKDQIEQTGLEFSEVQGNYIKRVYPNSPAANAGLQDGDVVTHINGKSVPTYYTFVKALSFHYGKAQDVVIEFIRGDVRLKTTTRLTYEDHFTGMVDPNVISLEEVRTGRCKRIELCK